jgi:hypothetical protein
MVLRESPPPMAKDEPHMSRRIATEVLWSIAKSRVAGIFHRGNGAAS